jgi:hypothetical protein
MRHASTIVVAGLVSGAVDILAAFASYTAQGATVQGILKYIASGLLGPAAMQGGVEIAWVGLLCHFLLATAMAAIYLGVEHRRRPALAHLLRRCSDRAHRPIWVARLTKCCA